jgi:hypothetical protein
VADFLAPVGIWNEQLLNRWFYQIDVEAIMHIRPSRRDTEDFIAWQPDKHGVFFVSSAYKLSRAEQMRMQELGRTNIGLMVRDQCGI